MAGKVTNAAFQLLCLLCACDSGGFAYMGGTSYYLARDSLTGFVQLSRPDTR
jgi:hypothetical protein